MNQSRVNIHSLASSLWRQALSGDTDAARHQLEQMELSEMPILAADLLARLYVQRGQIAQAREIWGMILRVDPSYFPAVQAMKKLDSTWLIRAVTRKYTAWFASFVAVIFGIFGAVSMLFGGSSEQVFTLGAAIILAVLAIYLVGLFTWAYLTAESLFGFGERMIYPQPPVAETRTSSNSHSRKPPKRAQQVRNRDVV